MDIYDTAEHKHRDPRGVANKEGYPDKAHIDPRTVNHGAMKARGVPRNDPVINWGRKAAHPKEK